MSTRPGSVRPPRLLRRLAALLIRGPDAPWVLAELDEAFERDLERGIPPRRAARRYLRNLVASSLSVARYRRRRSGPRRPSLGASVLDVKLGLRMLHKHPALTAVAVLALSIGIPVGLIPFHFKGIEVERSFTARENVRAHHTGASRSRRVR